MTSEHDIAASEATLGDVEARLATIEARIAHPLSDEQKSEVRSRIGRSIALGVALRAYPLSNADQPEIALIPYRGDDR